MVRQQIPFGLKDAHTLFDPVVGQGARACSGRMPGPAGTPSRTAVGPGARGGGDGPDRAA